VEVTLTNLGIESGHLNVFFRYSADLVHWSSWYSMTLSGAGAPDTRAEYQGNVSLPHVAGEEYARLMREWWQTGPQWSSDEHEFCVWLATHYRGYFSTEVPFVGYVQVRLEGNAGAFRLGSINVKQSSGSSGLQSLPKGTRRATANGEWFFDLNKVGRE
jgi:hypothetical protein